MPRRGRSLLAAAAVLALVLAHGVLQGAAPSTNFAAASPQRMPPRRAGASATAMKAASLLDGFTQIAEDLQDTLEDSFGSDGNTNAVLPKMQVSTLDMAFAGMSRAALMETMNIRAQPGSERRVARRLARFVADAEEEGNAMTAVVTQSEEDPCDFMVILRYRDEQKMLQHQAHPSTKEHLEALEEHLERPIGLYLMDEQMGQLGMARHPFGPGGEGGRDDAIYSSRGQPQ
eukprot:CAMPEP_0178420866 /NCGR_PEP_ID=MMETSP0689_2-20121128/26354_1 /TAXON_ID=160604 /ORGANISM="Amphidinium massartii, Strain CS-259" /LENGTH=230 /DNA_ID=CAMNT_0020042363 /DNA_START=131 /DNA_END=823 /DNA_ORIENTATION=+